MADDQNPAVLVEEERADGDSGSAHGAGAWVGLTD
jgi:hypothetical protein